MDRTCENGLCVSFKKPRGVIVGSNHGKPIAFTLNPQDYIDLNATTGEFFVVNKFTGAKMKMIRGDSEVHNMDKRKMSGFIKSVKSSVDCDFWGKDSVLLDKL